MAFCKRKSPVVEVFKWEGTMEQAEEPMWQDAEEAGDIVWIVNMRTKEVSMKLMGNIICRGDYILRASNGTLSFCTSDTFNRAYELIEE